MAQTNWSDLGNPVAESSATDWSALGDPVDVPQKKKQNTSIAGDLVTGVKRGIEQLPGMATGLADLALSPVSAAAGVSKPVSKAADWLGEKTGFQPGKWAEEAQAEYSPEMQEASRHVQQAEGFFPTLQAIAQNPRYAANIVAESAPSTLAGGLLARGAMGAVMGAERLATTRAAAAAGDAAAKATLQKAATVAGGIGEGAVTAGQQMEQTGADVDPLRAAGAALGAGAGTGILGAYSGRLANRLGLPDVDAAIAAGTLGDAAEQGATRTARALAAGKRMALGAVQEGVFEEMPQSAQEQMWQNVAEGKPLDEGVGRAMAEGVIAGGAMGAGVNALPRSTRRVVADPQTGGTVEVDPNAGPLSKALDAVAVPAAELDATADADQAALRGVMSDYHAALDADAEAARPVTEPAGVVSENALPLVGQEPAPVVVQPIISGNETADKERQVWAEAVAKQGRGEILTAAERVALRFPPEGVTIPTETANVKANVEANNTPPIPDDPAQEVSPAIPESVAEVATEPAPFDPAKLSNQERIALVMEARRLAPQDTSAVMNNPNIADKLTALHAVIAQAKAAQAAETPLVSEQASPEVSPTKSPRPKQPPNMRRDDLIGAIMRITGGDGIHPSMATTLTGDTANKASKLRGLFTNRGQIDMDDLALRLREDENYYVTDGNHLAELVREAAAGNVAVSMDRQQREMESGRRSEQRADAPATNANFAGTGTSAPHIARLLKAAPEVKVHAVADLNALPTATEALTNGRMSKHTAKAIKQVMGLLGRKVEFYEADQATPEGVNHDGKTLYVNVDSGVDALAVAGHEFAHSLKHTQPAVYAKAHDAAVALLKADPRRAVKYRKYYGKENGNGNIDAIAHEFLSDIGGNEARSGQFWGDVFDQIHAKHKPGQARMIVSRIRDALVTFINKLIRATPKRGFDLEAQGFTSEELATVREHIVTAAAESFLRAKGGSGVTTAAEADKTASYSPARTGYTESHELPDSRSNNRPLDGERLRALRRAAADLERTSDGLFLRITESGDAIATGQKGQRIPESFRRFADENGLTFKAERRLPQYAANRPASSFGNVTPRSEPMPVEYRQDGATYFGESTGVPLDRTEKTRFSLARTITVDGIERPTTNSLGKPIHPTENGVRNFWRWYDGLQRERLDRAGQGGEGYAGGQQTDLGVSNRHLFDEQGRPRVFYHGTNADISEFDLEHPDKWDHGWLGRGVYLGSDPDLANFYANQKGGQSNVMPLYAGVTHPYVFSAEEKRHLSRMTPEAVRAITERAMDHGYDGGVLEFGDGSVELVAFKNTAVKSATGNDGQFNPANPDIRYSTRRWEGVRTRDDYLVPNTPYYATNDQAIDLAEHDGLPVRLNVGNDAAKYGMDHLYKNGVADTYRAADPVEGDVGEGHIRDALRVLKTATLSYPNTNGKTTLRSALMSKAIVLQKRNALKTGEPYWSVITVIPATQTKAANWGVPERIKAPHLLDPVDSTSTASYYRDGTNNTSTSDRRGLLNSEWFDVTRPDGGNQPAVSVKRKKVLDSTKLSTRRIIGDSGRNYDPAQRQLFKNVGRDVEKLNPIEKVKAWANRNWVQGLVDQFDPIKALDKGAYALARLSKGATGAFEAFMHHGKLSVTADGAYDADTSGGVLEQVFYPIGKETTDFLYWVAGNRAERLAKEGKENLFSAADIAAAKSLAQGQTDFDYTLPGGAVTRNRALIYQDTLKKFNGFSKNVLDVAEQSGLIDGASRHIWEHDFYVPFYRLTDDEVRGATVGKGLARQKAFQKLKGGTEQLNDLLSNTLMNWAHLIDASAKNRAARATLQAAEKVGAARPAVHGEKKTVWYSEKGAKQEFIVDDPHLLVAINGLDYAGLRGPMMDALSKAKHWLTMGVTASPFFKVRNLIRDSVQAIGVSDLSMNPIKNVKDGFELSKRDRQEYVSALAGGALIRFGTMLEGNEAARVRQLIKKGAKDEHILDSESKIRAFYDTYLEPGIAAYNELGNRGEEINRMALYDQLIKQGKSQAEASLLARDLMDFSMQGSFTTIRFLTQIVPFMNARLQGMYKLGRAAKDDPSKMAIVTGAAALVSLSLLAAYGDDDDWKRREAWDRDNYWWFKVAGTAFRVPKPFELGAVGTLAERTAEYLFNTEMTGTRFKESVVKILGDQLSMNPLPQLVKPILDIYSNKDSFTGRPIESMAMEKLDPQYRYSASTSLPARGLSQVIGGALSPVQIDHLVRGYFSWLGATAVATADLAFRAVSDEPSRPTADYVKMATGGMAADLDSAGSKYVSWMYEQAKAVEEAYGTHRQLLKEGRQDEAAAYREANQDRLLKYRSTENIKKRVSEIGKQIRAIERSDKDADRKLAEINYLRRQQETLAKRLAI